MKRSIPFALFSLCSLSGAQDAQITTLAKTLLSLREYAASHSGLHGGLPELTLAKHQLRDWIEFRLASFPENGDTVALSNDFLTGITNAKLFCDDPSDCVANSLGFLDQIQVTREHGFLIIMTAVGTGIRCGYDYSAYVYEFSPALQGGDAPPVSPALQGGDAPPVSPARQGEDAPPISPARQGGDAPPISPARQGGDAPPINPARQGGDAPPISPARQGGDAPPVSPAREGGGAPLVSPARQGGDAPPVSPAREGGDAPPVSPARQGGDAPPVSPARQGGDAPPVSPARQGGDAPSVSPARQGGDAPPVSPARQGGDWRRVWENEQNDYTEGAYHPQTLHSVHISEADAGGARLVLTLGTPAGCGGAFVPLYYRVFRATTPGAGASLILDKSETLTDEGEPPAIGRLTSEDLLIEFSAGGVGYGFSHKALRHYEIHGPTATQTDPIAPTPRDFVEEWLAAPWQDSVARSDSPALREWHDKLHRDDAQGDYPDPALRCMADPSLVEIATHLEGSPNHYFLVRRKEPLRFSMAGIGEIPFADCMLPDPEADKQPSILPSNR